MDLALDVLDGGSLRFDVKLKVTRADYGSTAHKSRAGAYDDAKRRRVNATKAKVAKKATAQQQTWADDEDSGANSQDALRIIVVEGCFEPADMLPDAAVDDDEGNARVARANAAAKSRVEQQLLQKLGPQCEPEKLTVCAQHPRGVVIVKFNNASDAGDAVKRDTQNTFFTSAPRLFATPSFLFQQAL